MASERRYRGHWTCGWRPGVVIESTLPVAAGTGLSSWGRPVPRADPSVQNTALGSYLGFWSSESAARASPRNSAPARVDRARASPEKQDRIAPSVGPRSKQPPHRAFVSAARSGVAPGRRCAAGRDRFACDRLLRRGRATGRGGELGGAQASGGGTVMVPTSRASSAGSRSARVRAQSRGQSSR